MSTPLHIVGDIIARQRQEREKQQKPFQCVVDVIDKQKRLCNISILSNNAYSYDNKGDLLASFNRGAINMELRQDPKTKNTILSVRQDGGKSIVYQVNTLDGKNLTASEAKGLFDRICRVLGYADLNVPSNGTKQKPREIMQANNQANNKDTGLEL